jgi:hypothetical protein
MNKPPEYKTTTTLDAPPSWAIALSREVKEGFLRVEANLGAVDTEVRTLAARVGVLEGRTGAVEARQNTSSERVKHASEVDMKHEGAIATILEKVEALEKRPDTGEQVLAALDKLSERPLVKKLTAVVVPVLMLAITLIGLKLQAQVAKLEEHPPVPVPVYQPDGGAK